MNIIYRYVFYDNGIALQHKRLSFVTLLKYFGRNVFNFKRTQGKQSNYQSSYDPAGAIAHLHVVFDAKKLNDAYEWPWRSGSSRVSSKYLVESFSGVNIQLSLRIQQEDTLNMS